MHREDRSTDASILELTYILWHSGTRISRRMPRHFLPCPRVSFLNRYYNLNVCLVIDRNLPDKRARSVSMVARLWFIVQPLHRFIDYSFNYWLRDETDGYYRHLSFFLSSFHLQILICQHVILLQNLKFWRKWRVRHRYFIYTISLYLLKGCQRAMLSRTPY